MAPSSEESDLELRDAVLRLLEDTGALSRIKAELRSCVFQALCTSNKLSGKLPSSIASKFGANAEGRLALSLVRDLLQCLDLNFTLSVFDAEVEPNTLLGRTDAANKLDIASSDDSPLLSSLLRLSTGTSRHKPMDAEDVQSIFAEQSFFAQLDKAQEKTGSAPEHEKENLTVEETVEIEMINKPDLVIDSPPKSPDGDDQLREKTEIPTKLSPLRPLSSLKKLPQLQAPAKLPRLERVVPPVRAISDGDDSGDDVESLGDDLLASLGDSSTNETSVSRAEIADCDYVESVA